VFTAFVISFLSLYLVYGIAVAEKVFIGFNIETIKAKKKAIFKTDKALREAIYCIVVITWPWWKYNYGSILKGKK